jgi:hypothetical protein
LIASVAANAISSPPPVKPRQVGHRQQLLALIQQRQSATHEAGSALVEQACRATGNP